MAESDVLVGRGGLKFQSLEVTHLILQSVTIWARLRFLGLSLLQA
jgi:hypothetical protein